MKIGLLFGGRSFEHDISIVTANIVYHALKEAHEVYLLYIDKEGDFRLPSKINISDFANNKKFKRFNFIKKGISCRGNKQKIDVLMTTMHGINGEDGLAAIVAKLYDIPFVGCNHLSSGLLMDKYFTYAILRSLNINTIESKFYLKNQDITLYNFPLIVKPARLGSSIGISKIKDSTDVKLMCDNAFSFDDKIIIQPYIDYFKEYNQAAYVFQNEIITSNIEEVFKSEEILSFDDKYLNSKIEKKRAFITDEILVSKITELSKKIYRDLELSGIVRIDYMVIDDEVLVNEINTTPGSLAYYLFEDKLIVLLEKQIKQALLNHQNEKNTFFKSSILSQKYMLKK